MVYAQWKAWYVSRVQGYIFLLYSSVLQDVDLMCSQHCSDVAVPGCVIIASSSMVDLLSVPEDAQMCMNLFSVTFWLLQDKHIPGAVFFDVDAISDLTSHVSPLTAVWLSFNVNSVLQCWEKYYVFSPVYNQWPALIHMLNFWCIQLPHMLPSEAAFEAAVSALGIQNDSLVVVYDTKGIFSVARVWWYFAVPSPIEPLAIWFPLSEFFVCDLVLPFSSLGLVGVAGLMVQT